ncbi:MAG TPA: hypothetical protein VE545_00095 [Candidatus Dormibacteraeota bacterium]|nr:hypothetical protein [Candidatus Dormibacteraeota bacterium]
MIKTASSSGLGRLPKWQIALCLLLAALVVYNPYLSAADSSVGLCLRHSASFRATLGASELQHFTPKDPGPMLAGLAAVVLASFLQDSLPQNSERHPDVAHRAAPPEQALPASLWFRPPPAV